MKQLMRWFGNGLLFLIPVGGTLYLIYLIFSKVDAFVRAPLEQYLGPMVTGVGVLITIAVILLIGMLTSLFITRPLVSLIDKIFSRMPLVKLLYNSLKDLIGAFVGDKKKFNRPVIVEMVPGSQIKALGFITREALDFFDLQDTFAVYFPQSYNFAGNMMLIPKEQVTSISDIEASDVMAFIVSGGVSGPGNQNDKPDAQHPMRDSSEK